MRRFERITSARPRRERRRDRGRDRRRQPSSNRRSKHVDPRAEHRRRGRERVVARLLDQDLVTGCRASAAQRQEVRPGAADGRRDAARARRRSDSRSPRRAADSRPGSRPRGRRPPARPGRSSSVQARRFEPARSISRRRTRLRPLHVGGAGADHHVSVPGSLPLRRREEEVHGDAGARRAMPTSERLGFEATALATTTTRGRDEEGRDDRDSPGVRKEPGSRASSGMPPPEEEDRRHGQAEEDPVAEDDRVHEIAVGARRARGRCPTRPAARSRGTASGTAGGGGRAARRRAGPLAIA